jgi:radical SAM superfamily enzyme
MEREAYIDVVCKAIELLPPDTVVARVTGDGMADDLLAPMWSKRKVAVINDIDKLLFERQTCQGAKYSEKYSEN